MAFIRAFGSYFPSRIVPNQEVGALVGVDAAWIEAVSGIQERRYAAPGESVADMAVAAAGDCLARAGIAPANIGHIIVNTSTADRQFPGPAAEVGSRLGCSCGVLDLSHASTGGLLGMEVARHLAPSYGDILVIAAEKMSSVILRAPLDRATVPLFGDGAGACLISPSSGSLRIVDSLSGAAGEFRDDLELPWDQPLKMSGRTVILQASRRLPHVIAALLQRNRLTPTRVDQFILHQANQILIQKVASALRVDSSRFYSHIASFGNISSASMLAAAAEYSAKYLFHEGVVVCFAVFGSGFQWAAMLGEGSTCG